MKKLAFLLCLAFLLPACTAVKTGLSVPKETAEFLICNPPFIDQEC